MQVPALASSSSSGTTLGAAVYTAFLELRREVRRSARDRIEGDPLTASQGEVLGCLRRMPGVGVGELARTLRLAPNTVSTIVGALVTAGLVRRDPDPDDARAVRLRLTPAGHRRTRAWRDHSARRVDEALAHLSAEERADLARALPVLERLAEIVASSS